MKADQGSKIRARVVLADDNDAIRDLVAQILEPTYDLVGSVADGQSLVEAVSRLRPDVGIVDISMPVMNGIEAVAEIRQSGSDVKIVFLTVNEDRDFVDAAFEAGGNSFVIKRKMASDLLLGLRAALSGGTFVSTW